MKRNIQTSRTNRKEIIVNTENIAKNVQRGITTPVQGLSEAKKLITSDDKDAYSISTIIIECVRKDKSLKNDAKKLIMLLYSSNEPKEIRTKENALRLLDTI